MLSVSHVGHAEVSKFIMQKATLIFPQITNAINDTCKNKNTQTVLNYIYKGDII